MMRPLLTLVGLLLVLLMAVRLVAQNAPPVPAAIVIVSPSNSSTLMGVLSIDVSVTSATVNVSALKATLTKDGLFEPLAVTPLTKSGNDHYIAVMPLPSVTVASAHRLTVTDGTVSAVAFFTVAPSSAPTPPTDGHSQIMAMLSVMAARMDTGFAHLAPFPTPQGTPCTVVSATTVYTSNGHYKVTLDCPQTITPAPPVKGAILQVIPQSLSGVVVK